MRERLPTTGRAAVGLLFALLATGAAAQTVSDVYPVEPRDGARVGARPTFRVGVDGTDVLKIKFKIVLSRDDFETEAYVLDQRENRNGWAVTGIAGFDEEGAIHRTRQTLDDGTYDWKVYAWNGLEWIEGDDVFRVHVDNTPPADVERVRIGKDRDGNVKLAWDPVTRDKNGGTEYVKLYHVYRYKNVRPYNYMRVFEIGTTEDPEFVDTTLPAGGLPLVFYKIKAEDDAGNRERHKWRQASADDQPTP